MNNAVEMHENEAYVFPQFFIFTVRLNLHTLFQFLT